MLYEGYGGCWLRAEFDCVGCRCPNADVTWNAAVANRSYQLRNYIVDLSYSHAALYVRLLLHVTPRMRHVVNVHVMRTSCAASMVLEGIRQKLASGLVLMTHHRTAVILLQ
jgi:hypothetical protein